MGRVIDIVLFLVTTAIFLFGFHSSCFSATNIALGRPYTVFPAPNYRLTAPPTDTTALTDGVYSDKGVMWTEKTTVGWQGASLVRVLIDLGKTSSIESIAFSTAKGNSGDVNFPETVSAFVGPDQDHLLYVGDVASGRDTTPTQYRKEHFVLDDIHASGRFVLLQVQVNGLYLFCDEIEVKSGADGGGRVGTLNIEETQRMHLDRIILQDLVERLRPQLTRLPEFSDKLRVLEQGLRNADAALDQTQYIEDALLKLRAEALRAVFPGMEFLVEEVLPWGNLSWVAAPSGVVPQNLAFHLPEGGYGSVSLVVTNLTAESRRFSVVLDRSTVETAEIDLYQVPFVRTAAMEAVPDPLTPMGKDFTLRSGESRMIFVVARGTRRGVCQSNLEINSEGVCRLIPVSTVVVGVTMPERLSLNSVNWNYLDFRPTKSLKKTAVKDLFDHHTNTAVIPSWALALSDRPGVSDVVRMNSAFEQRRGVDKIILFMTFNNEHIRTIGGTRSFLGVEWQAWFHGWYQRMMKAAVAAGFSQDQIYLYPYDEPGGQEIDQLIAFSSWVRKEYPGVRLYATLGKMGSEKSLPYLNIAQVINDENVLSKFSRSLSELWIYDAKMPAKSLSPYAYYRLMAWKAFLNDYKGIGFWAYADTGWEDDPGSAWDDFDGKYPDFAVIYEGPGNTIVSSRRWEAWRMGIEDYELLSMYAKAKGDNIAKALAKNVLNHPDETTLADEVRRKILQELSTN